MAPTYGSGSRGRLPDPNESWFSRYYRDQIAAPQYLAGNLSILTSIGLFAGGIAAVRQWGPEVLTMGL